VASAGSDQTVRLWSVAAAKEVRRFQGIHRGASDTLAFSPDGRTLASAGPRYLGSLYNHPFGNPINQFGAAGGQFGLMGGLNQFGNGGFNQFGNLGGHFGLQGGGMSQQQVLLWELASGRERGWVADGSRAVRFAPDGKSLLLGIKNNKVVVQKLAALAPPTRGGIAPATDPSTLWSDLIGTDATRAYRAVWQLAAAPERALPVLRDNVRPARPPVDPAVIDRLIADLDSNSFSVRQKASEELEQLGRQTEPALRKVLGSRQSLELTKRVERLLNRLSERGLAPEAVRITRAVEALEHINTSEARGLLETLAAGLPGHVTTDEARAALTRMNQVASP
jgi:hypothetical protein